MSRLEDIKPRSQVSGVVAGAAVEVVSVEWICDQAVNVVYRSGSGSVVETSLYRDDEHRLKVETQGQRWSFDADGALLRLVTETYRINLAHFFDSGLDRSKVITLMENAKTLNL